MQKVDAITGFKRFGEKQQRTLKAFYLNFMDGWGTEARSSIIPISFSVRNNKMVFNYIMWGTERYLYVIGPTIWY